ncbi:unnamed protein product [Closterium sp. NIES-54]
MLLPTYLVEPLPPLVDSVQPHTCHHLCPLRRPRPHRLVHCRLTRPPPPPLAATTATATATATTTATTVSCTSLHFVPLPLPVLLLLLPLLQHPQLRPGLLPRCFQGRDGWHQTQRAGIGAPPFLLCHAPMPILLHPSTPLHRSSPLCTHLHSGKIDHESAPNNRVHELALLEHRSIRLPAHAPQLATLATRGCRADQPQQVLPHLRADTWLTALGKVSEGKREEERDDSKALVSLYMPLSSPRSALLAAGLTSPSRYSHTSGRIPGSQPWERADQPQQVLPYLWPNAWLTALGW